MAPPRKHQTDVILDATRALVLAEGPRGASVGAIAKASGAPAMYRGGGSIGIIGAARQAFVVAKNPHDEDSRLLAPTKNNLCKSPMAK